MDKQSLNIRFQLLVNGQTVATAGLESYGVLTSDICWVKRDPEKLPAWTLEEPDFDEDEWTKEKLDIRLGGLDSMTEEHIVWFQKSLNAGDEITIRILESGEVNAPVSRRRDTTLRKAQMMLKHLRRGLQSDVEQHPHLVILEDDGRYITFNNIVDDLESEYEDIEGKFQLSGTSISAADLLEKVTELIALLDERDK